MIPKLPRQAETIEELRFLTIAMLVGKEDRDFVYYQGDADWWELRLSISKN